MNSKIIGTIGLSCYIIGAILVPIEVVKIYRSRITAGWDDEPMNKLEEPISAYKKFEKEKHIIMVVGLCFLFLGFVLQIVAL